MKGFHHHGLVDPIDARRSRTTGGKCDARGFVWPCLIRNQSQESIELAFGVLR